MNILRQFIILKISLVKIIIIISENIIWTIFDYYLIEYCLETIMNINIF